MTKAQHARNVRAYRKRESIGRALEFCRENGGPKGYLSTLGGGDFATPGAGTWRVLPFSTMRSPLSWDALRTLRDFGRGLS